ncbi:HD domain-containing protein [Exiguobacterium alkaliphilum]|uniref:HD domain-containing protein n=1 Tax=Exiguobacterium alkaliphilum TaxID=1428684 RepID=A0ABT2KZ29_9BACL|nr:HD domain-containing protein [Exiguobacterium alkaliphilum]MCT4795665.1 HD domain-containing protein [Exiguobacterium alkaliphilum]
MHRLVEEALRFAAARHDGQFRKGSRIPYVTHPVAVAMILTEDHQPVPVVAAALLHDVLEDTFTTKDELHEQFGPEVARLVEAVSEPDKSLPWEQRKQAMLERIPSLEYDEIALLVADKLHNLRSIRLDIDVVGKGVWSRFRRPLRDQSWYYHELLEALRPFQSTSGLIEVYEQELNRLFYGTETERVLKLQKLSTVVTNGFQEEDWVQEAPTLYQTAFELDETMSVTERSDRSGGDDSILKGLTELSYRTALTSEDIVRLTK